MSRCLQYYLLVINKFCIAVLLYQNKMSRLILFLRPLFKQKKYIYISLSAT